MRNDPLLDASSREISLAGALPNLVPILAALGAGALALAFVLGALTNDGFRTFLHSYLVNYCFFLSISLGAVFFVASLHATRAGWGVSVRRVAEILASAFPAFALLFLPILVPMLLGNAGLYAWVDPNFFAEQPTLAQKTHWLNVPFFTARTVGYLIAWWLVARFFLFHSTEQDTSGDPRRTSHMERWSGPALVLLGVTGTLAAFDWIMSLQPAWYSTIFGLYFYSGGVVGALAAVILTVMALQRSGRLSTLVTVEHYHDLGKLLLTAVIFWGYMAFSQYMLIWYANIPEETQWFLPRQAGLWGVLGLVLVFGHLFIPFFGLLSRGAKRRKGVLAFWAAWMLVMHWLDLYWVVMPNLEHNRFTLGVMDLCLLLAIGCFLALAVWRVAAQRSLLPVRDPRLAEALALENT